MMYYVEDWICDIEICLLRNVYHLDNRVFFMGH